MSVISQSPLGSAAVVGENILLVIMSIINLILLILFSLALELNTTFIVFPLTIEWFMLVLVGIYLLVRKSRARSTPSSLSGAAFMFGTQTILGLVSSVAITDRAWSARASTLCDDFVKIPNSCRVALAVVGLSWLGTTAAFAGILLSVAGPLYRSYIGIRRLRRHKITHRRHVIELVDVPSASYQPSLDKGKGREEWTEIPLAM
ncbi:hypothetical protein K438DRAFT_1248019 [Mycena galopus ATCC 62051]|nr:hypothetical protein K438DRAFT_1248019 [Mycena galopus ATCC 62051]